MQFVKRGLFILLAMLFALPFFSSQALARDWDYDFYYGDNDQSIRYTNQNNDFDKYFDNNYGVYSNQTYWDFANENNWSNDDYWTGIGDWNNWRDQYRDHWRNYYQAYTQNRDYHPINMRYFDRDGRYSYFASDNNYRRRIIWANQNSPIGRFNDYPESWYNSWRNWDRNYARGVAIRDRNNYDDVIIIANSADISGGGNYINIERATVVVDSDVFDEICNVIDNNNGDWDRDLRFNRYDNTLGYNWNGNWRSYNANYSYY